MRDLFTSSIDNILGPGNRNVKRLTAVQCSPTDGVVTIKWAINDNFSEAWIKRGAMIDIEKMLRYISQHGGPCAYKEIVFDGSFALVDAYGNEQEGRAVLASYTVPTIYNINWDNLITDDIFTIADSLYLHPAFSPNTDS